MNRTKNIAIQGYPGAFHEIAARLFYRQSPVDIIPADTFEDVVSMVEKNGQADAGLMAIENSIAGSLLQNYGLINQSNIHICGEIYLRIKQNLLVTPGRSIADITEVHSHYMAIAQCKSFFKKHPHIKLVESTDTAKSARKIGQQNLTHVGAIASGLAAELYDLDILSESIETNKQNYTRFFVLQKNGASDPQSDFDKVSISFTVGHQVGSLYHTLKILNDYQANLTKIQSMPISGRPWEYLFFIDFILKEQEAFMPLTGALSKATHELKILGKYKSGVHHES